VITRIGVDSASLFVQRDSSSFFSGWSDNLSKFSIQFDFDRELFVTKVYEKVIRSSVKDSLRQKHGLTRPAEDSHTSKKPARLTHSAEVESKKRSRAIDRGLKWDATRTKRECKILLLGSADSGKEHIVEQMNIMHWKGYLNAFDSHDSLLLDYILALDPNEPLDSMFVDAIRALRRDPCFEKVMKRSHELYSMNSAP
jgi:hypothetical protein